jgi:hypothetical protein
MKSKLSAALAAAVLAVSIGSVQADTNHPRTMIETIS